MTNRSLRIIYVGQLTPGMYGTCEQRLEALRDLGHTCVEVHSEITTTAGKFERKLRMKLLNSRFNRRINEAVRKTIRSEEQIDLVWFDKSLETVAQTFHAIRQAYPHVKIVGYSPDDLMNPSNQSRQLFETLPLYDVFFTTKSYNVSELITLGTPRVEFVDNAFHPALHRPIVLSADEKAHRGAPVGFIGFAEEQRARSIEKLARAGIEVKVWGPLWDRRKTEHDATYTVGGSSQWGEGFSRTVCAFDINLGFLRKENRDLQTTRSIEIPACGAFMLAERTDEHMRLFTEGQEAEFFSSDDELLEKVRYYLANPEKRRRIAAAGRERCLRDGYSNQDRLSEMLNRVFAA